MSKVVLSVEMNHLFEFYAEVREGDTVLYTSAPYVDSIYAKRDGLIWMENNGYELEEPDNDWHEFSMWNERQPEIGKRYDVVIPGVVYEGKGMFYTANGYSIVGAAQYRKAQ